MSSCGIGVAGLTVGIVRSPTSSCSTRCAATSPKPLGERACASSPELPRVLRTMLGRAHHSTALVLHCVVYGRLCSCSAYRSATARPTRRTASTAARIRRGLYPPVPGPCVPPQGPPAGAVVSTESVLIVRRDGAPVAVWCLQHRAPGKPPGKASIDCLIVLAHISSSASHEPCTFIFK